VTAPSAGYLPVDMSPTEGRTSAADSASDRTAAAADGRLDPPYPHSSAIPPSDPLLDTGVRALAAGVTEDRPLGRRGRPLDPGSPFFVGLTAAVGVGVVVLLGWAVVAAHEVLLLFAVAFLLALGLDPMVRWLGRHGIPRPVGVVLVTLLALGVFAAFLALAIPVTAREATAFVHNAPKYLDSLNNRHGFIGRLVARYHLAAKLKAALTGHNGDVATGIVGAGKVVLGAVTSTVLVLVLMVYFLVDLPRLKRSIYRLAPRSRRPRAGLLGDEIFDRVGGYVLGNVITSVVAGIGTFAWLAGWGVPYPLLLGFFVAIVDLVPVIGSTIGGIVVSLVALTVSLPVAIATLAFYVFYRLFEDYLLTPRVMRYTVAVPALATVAVVILGGVLLGILGAVVAIPVAAAVKVWLDEIAHPYLDVH
jgi:predicted PurR-regulated permease PerM